jgi:hypothetical protein
MSPYWFQPVEREKNNSDWRISSVGVMEVGVLAKTEEEASQLISQALFDSVTRASRTDKTPFSPWQQSNLTICMVDDSRPVRPGIVLTATGEEWPIDEDE